MYDMYPWDKRSAAEAGKPGPAINAVQVALDRRDNGGDPAAGTPASGPARQ
ncbi:MAG TPA: hypothetical protein VMA97_03950 [Streptosporangiaceae bacterium]|nr:hypothetical protein [Streptosporangiaceae bacterium]